MCIKLILDTLTAVGTVGAVIIAMFAINRNDKNSKEQILTNKLEELLELIKTLAKYYITLKDVYNDILNLRNSDFKELETRAQYFDLRDVKLPLNEREKIFNMLSRIEVLAKCYTSNNIKDDILKYEDLIYTLTELAATAGSISELIRWKDGFPTYEEFYKILLNIEENIIEMITARK